MMLLTMNTYLCLLWGISVLFSTETKSASIPETNSTAEPSTAIQLNTSHVLHYETETLHTTQDPAQKPAEISGVATAQAAVSPTMETQEANVSSKSSNANVSVTSFVVMNTAATTTSSLSHILTSASEAQPSHNTMMSKTAKATENQQSPNISTKMTPPSTLAVTATSSAAFSATAASSSPHPTSTTGPEVTTLRLTGPEITSEPPKTTTGPEVTTLRLTGPEITSEPTKTTTGPEATTKLTATTGPEVTSELSSSTSSDNVTQPPHIQNLSTPSASTMTTHNTSLAAPVLDLTSLPITITETAPTSTEVTSTSQPIYDAKTHSSTSAFRGSNSTTESPTMSVSTDSANSTTASSSTFNTTGVLIHRVPKRVSITTTTSPTTTTTTITTTALCEGSHNSDNTGVLPCSTRGVVKNCLIIIASLAGLATIFMVSTIVLCTKLSAKKYKVKKTQQETEMICISALLPEKNYTYSRQRNPVSNGVLVIPVGGDSDEDGGDNLTLSSFLPENERTV